MNFIKPPTLYVVEGHKPLYVGVWGNSSETNRLSEFFRNFSISHPALLLTWPKKRTYVSPNYSLKAAWTGQWLIVLLIQL